MKSIITIFHQKGFLLGSFKFKKHEDLKLFPGIPILKKKF